MIYFAHRGASALAPANSVEAFIYARKQGATCYELDVHLTQDKKLVVQHDYELGNTARKIKEFDYANLQNFCKQNNLMCPVVLEEIFPVVRQDLACLNIELKNDDNVYPGIEQTLLDVVSSHAPDLQNNILFSSFDYPTLQRLRTLAPGAKIGLLTRLFDPEQVRALQACSVHINQTRVTREIVQACHAEGRKVFVYTVNDKAAEAHLALLGIDGIFTDNPGLFL